MLELGETAVQSGICTTPEPTAIKENGGNGALRATPEKAGLKPREG